MRPQMVHPRGTLLHDKADTPSHHQMQTARKTIRNYCIVMSFAALRICGLAVAGRSAAELTGAQKPMPAIVEEMLNQIRKASERKTLSKRCAHERSFNAPQHTAKSSFQRMERVPKPNPRSAVFEAPFALRQNICHSFCAHRCSKTVLPEASDAKENDKTLQHV